MRCILSVFACQNSGLRSAETSRSLHLLHHSKYCVRQKSPVKHRFHAISWCALDPSINCTLASSRGAMSSKFLQKFQEKITVVGRDGSTQPVCVVGVPSSPKRHHRFPDNHHSSSAQSRSSASEFSFGQNAGEDAFSEPRRPCPPHVSRPSGEDAASGVSSTSSHNPNRKLTVRDLRRYSESAYDQPSSSQSQTSTIRPSPRVEVAADNYFDSLLSHPLPLRQAQTAHPSVGQREYAAAAAASRARESVSQAQSHSQQYLPRKDSSTQRSLSIPRARKVPIQVQRAQPPAQAQLPCLPPKP